MEERGNEGQGVLQLCRWCDWPIGRNLEKPSPHKMGYMENRADSVAERAVIGSMDTSDTSDKPDQSSSSTPQRASRPASLALPSPSHDRLNFGIEYQRWSRPVSDVNFSPAQG